MAKKRKRRKKVKTKFQLQLQALGFRTYAAYLKSEHWTEFKEGFFAKHKKICYCCNKPARDVPTKTSAKKNTATLSHCVGFATTKSTPLSARTAYPSAKHTKSLRLS